MDVTSISGIDVGMTQDNLGKRITHSVRTLCRLKVKRRPVRLPTQLGQVPKGKSPATPPPDPTTSSSRTNLPADVPSTGPSQSEYGVSRGDEYGLKGEREGNVTPGSLPEYIGSGTGVSPDGDPSSEQPSSDESLQCLDSIPPSLESNSTSGPADNFTEAEYTAGVISRENQRRELEYRNLELKLLRELNAVRADLLAAQTSILENRTELAALKSERRVTLEQMRQLRSTMTTSGEREAAISNALIVQTELANALQTEKTALLTQSQTTEQRLSQENRELRATNDSLRQQLRSERQRKNQIALQRDLEKERNLHDKARMKEAHEQEITEREAAYSTLQSAHNAEVGTSRRLQTALDAERLRCATEKRTVQELRRQLEEERRRPIGMSAKQLELQRIVGVPVTVRRVNSGGESSEEDLNRLTPLMQTHLKTAVEKFRTYRQVKRIEYILNDRLYWQYDDTKWKFSSHTRPATEYILFHGTNGRNIDL